MRVQVLLLAALLSLLFVAGAASQAAAPAPETMPATQLERVLDKRGVVLIKAFRKLGKISQFSANLELEILEVSVTGSTDAPSRGLRFIATSGMGDSERSEISYLDANEAVDLAGAMDQMKDLAQKWKTARPANYTEVEFSSLSAFELGFYQDGSEQKFFVTTGRVYKAHFAGDMNEFAKVHQMVQKAAASLRPAA